MKYLIQLLALCLLAFPIAAGATENAGAACDSDTDVVASGGWVTVACRKICATAVAANDTCAEWDFRAGAGMPDKIVFEREENDANCSDAGGPTFTLTTGPTTGGSPSYVFDTTPVVLNDATPRVVVIVKDADLSAYLFTAITDDTGCTDVDVRMYLKKWSN